jgi:hypothetical protein
LKAGEEKNDQKMDIEKTKEKISFCVFMLLKDLSRAEKDAQKEILAELGSNRKNNQ